MPRRGGLMSADCFAPWCGIDGKYANPGVCNAPGGHAHKAPTSRTDEAPHLDEPNGAEGGIPSEAGKPAGPASPKPLDYDEDEGGWVCQLHGTLDCEQRPECIASVA